MLLRLAHGEFPEMEHARGEHRVGAALEHAGGEVLERAHAARGDHRHFHRRGHGGGKRQIEAVARAVAVHAGEQDLARAGLLHALRPFDRVEAGRLAPAMGEDFPGSAFFLRIDGDDDALAADDAGSLAHQPGVVHRGGVDRDLVGAGVEQAPHVLDPAHPAPDGERDEHALRHRLDHVQQDVALIRARGDVEEAQLVGALLVVARRDLDRVARVAQPDEVDALHHPPGRDVQAGDDPFRERHIKPCRAPCRRRPARSSGRACPRRARAPRSRR